MSDTERAYKRGAHHAATYLAQALGNVKTMKQARQIVDAFADHIQVARKSEDQLNLLVLLSRSIAPPTS